MQTSENFNKDSFFNQVKYLDANFNQILLKFKFFCSLHTEIPKWCMYSDYSFEKSNNTFTFVIVPAERYLIPLNSKISKLLPKDIKHTRSITEEKSNLLTSNFFFSVSFILDNENKILANISKEFILEYLNILLSNKNLKISNEDKEKINLLIDDVKKKNFNKKLFHRIAIVTYLAAYMEYKFNEAFSGKLKAFGWFSDRDKITTAYNGIYSIFFSINRNNILEYIDTELSLRYIFAQELGQRKYKISIPAQKIFKEKFLFYDNYNRIADYICATVADYNIINNIVTHNKFITMLEEVLTSQNHNIIKIGYNKISSIKIIYSQTRKDLSQKINKIDKILKKYENNKRVTCLKALRQKYKNDYDTYIE